MKKRWFVMDEENNSSYSASKEESEHFATLGAAQKRATDLANTEPGKVYYICETVQVAEAKIAPATLRKLAP